jgi:hypothetical protein
LNEQHTAHPYPCARPAPSTGPGLETDMQSVLILDEVEFNTIEDTSRRV